MNRVTCPLCEQYEAEPKSVRAHISAKRDETHQGESGFDYETELGLSEPESEPVPDETGPDPGLGEALGTEMNETSSEPNRVPTRDGPDRDDPDQDDSEPTTIPAVQSVERDEDDDGNELVKLTLYGAGAYALAKLLAGDQERNRRGKM